MESRIKQLRENRGLIQEILASELGITQQMLSKYERDVLCIKVDVLKKIAEYFNVTTDYLLGISEVKRDLQGQMKMNKTLDTYYDLIIDSYDYVGNYLITLYYDVYDVPLKGTDELAMDESDEVYEYLLCCICPVALSKPGLGYLEGEHRIGARIRDWVVGPTDTAFLFPAFNGRATDIHSTLVYTKNAKEPHEEFWANGLGCGTKRTATQKRDAFENMVVQTLGPDDEETKDTVLDVQQNLNDFILVEKEKVDKDEPIPLDGEMITEILTDAGISEPKAEKIKASYESFFEDTLPDAQELLDAKAIKNNEVRVEKKQLQEKVVDLTKKLEDAGVITSDGTDIDVVVKVTPEKVEEIHTAFVDGKRCLVIPMEDDEEAKINGETMSF